MLPGMLVNAIAPVRTCVSSDDVSPKALSTKSCTSSRPPDSAVILSAASFERTLNGCVAGWSRPNFHVNCAAFSGVRKNATDANPVLDARNALRENFIAELTPFVAEAASTMPFGTLPAARCPRDAERARGRGTQNASAWNSPNASSASRSLRCSQVPVCRGEVGRRSADRQSRHPLRSRAFDARFRGGGDHVGRGPRKRQTRRRRSSVGPQQNRSDLGPDRNGAAVLTAGLIAREALLRLVFHAATKSTSRGMRSRSSPVRWRSTSRVRAR